MSSFSEVNLKQTLRKVEFPLCAAEALKKVGDLLCSRTTNIKSMDLSLDLMAEFVFWEIDRRGNKKTQTLTPLVELQLLEIIFEYLNSIPTEVNRNTLFLNLFGPITVNTRLGILSKLVSLAVGVPSATILISVSTWMQQLGNLSPSSCKLAESLVFDYFHLVPNPEERLSNLPIIAPQFVANFLTAISENYFQQKKDPNYPPEILVKCIIKWISDNSTLCISAQQRQVVLPPGAIAMEATTPIAGLLRWCVLAPIHFQNDQLYSQLYLALLNSISEIPRTNTPKAISVQQLAVMIPPLNSYFWELKNKSNPKSENILTDAPLQLALDRIGQALQIALAANAIYGHLDEFFHNLQSLPFNKLVAIVINSYKENKVIVIS